MDFDYSTDEQLKVSIIKYAGQILHDFSKMTICTHSSPAPEHLFKIREGSKRKLLPEEQAQHCHHLVAQLPFLSLRARPDLQTLVRFLNKQVKFSDEDQGKQQRGLKYLKGTNQMVVDAPHNEHWDCKGYTGMMMLLGKGVAMSMSHTQKSNTCSPTEQELIGINDVLSNILWSKYFIESQGYSMEYNILLQDSKSTILLATYGTFSSSSKTENTSHKFFLIKGKIDQGDIEIQYKYTERMWSDMLIKPPQGKVFCEFCGNLMNVPENYNNEVERLNTHSDLLQEIRDKKLLSSTNTRILRKVLGSTGIPKTMTHRVNFTTDTNFTNTTTTTIRTLKKLIQNKVGTPQLHHRRVLSSTQSTLSVPRPEQGRKSGDMDSVRVLAQRIKSLRPAHDKIPLCSLYQHYLRNTSNNNKNKTTRGTIRDKIPMAKMYYRYLRSRSSNANHQ